MTSTRKVSWRARGGDFDRAAPYIARLSSAFYFARMPHSHNDRTGSDRAAALPRGAFDRPWPKEDREPGSEEVHSTARQSK